MPEKAPSSHSEHVVEQGEDVESVAFEHGLTWQTIWFDEANTQLRRERGDPQLLMPGDQLLIPAAHANGFQAPTERHHRFRLKDVPQKLIFTVMEQDQPLARERYVLVIDGTSVEGTTSASGEVRIDIPPDAREAELTVGEGEQQREYRINLGFLDPLDTAAGIQQRLRNLGYDCGDDDCLDELNSETVEALRAFQSHAGLQPTGGIDEETTQSLRDEHGC